ncbi:MAG: hypothetical protein ACXVEF_33305 [Polyangiales bacterium]
MRFALIALVPALALTACQQEELSRGEAQTAISEAAIEHDATSVTATPVEITTNFTIGKALNDAATELHAFLAAEVPCAKSTLSDHTITTVWGATTGCSYKGVTLTGTSAVTITRNDDGTVQVDHVWTDLSNGRVKVSGTANVTWSKADASRHVKHDLHWTRLIDGRTGHGTGDRVQRLLHPEQGLAGGIGIDGNRQWTNDRQQTWNLAITGVEVRLQDPVPQAGSYTLTNPAGKLLSVDFTRRDETSIIVEISNGKSHFSFVVKSAGTISDA